MYQRNSVDPNEQARRRAISSVLETPTASAAAPPPDVQDSVMPPRTATPDLYSRGPLPAGPLSPQQREAGVVDNAPEAPMSQPAASPPAPAPNPHSGIQASWDTDGYAAPASATAFNGNALPGWDAGKLADPNHQTPKYVWGRIASSIPDKAGQVAALLQAYPGAQFDGKDKITGIPGLGAIDIFGGAGEGRNTPQWIDEAAAASGAGGGGGTAQMKPFDTGGAGTISGSASALAPSLMGDSAYQNLLARLQALAGGGMSPDQMAISKVLGQ